MPRSSTAWKTRDDRDQKKAETGSKMTLLKSDWGVSGMVVGVFGDCGRACRKQIRPYPGPNTSENRDFVSKKRLRGDQISLFSKTI
jgi:hypothetical protein